MKSRPADEICGVGIRSVARPSQAVRFATGRGNVKRVPPGLGRPGDNDVAFAWHDVRHRVLDTPSFNSDGTGGIKNHSID